VNIGLFPKNVIVQYVKNNLKKIKSIIQKNEWSIFSENEGSVRLSLITYQK